MPGNTISVIKNKNLIEKIKREFEAVVPIAVNKRQEKIEPQWKEYKDIFEGVHNENKELFKSRYTKYAKDPSVQKALKRLISSIKRNVLPYDRPFEPYPVRAVEKEEFERLMESAEKQARFLEYQIFDINKIRERLIVFITQYVLYGIAVAKTYKKLVNLFSVLEDGTISRIERLVPAVDFVDIFRWYIYPDTISSEDNAKWMWEWMFVRTAKIRAFARSGIYDKAAVEAALSGGSGLISDAEKSEAPTRKTAVGYELGRTGGKATTARPDALIDPMFLEKDGGYSAVYEGFYLEDVEYTDKSGKRHKEDGRLERISFTYLNGEIVRAEIVNDHNYIITREKNLPNQFYQASYMNPVYRPLYLSEGLYAQGLEHLENSSVVFMRYDPRFGTKMPKTLTPITSIAAGQGAFDIQKAQNNTPQFMQMMALTQSGIRESLHESQPSVTNVSMRSRGQRTKGGMDQNREEAFEGILQISAKIEDEFFIKLLKSFHSMNEELQDSLVFPSKRKGVGSAYDNVVITPQDIKVKSTYKWLGSARVETEKRVSEGIPNIYALFSKLDIEGLGVEIDHMHLIREYIRTALGIRNADHIITRMKGDKIDTKTLMEMIVQLVEEELISKKAAQQILQLIQAIAQGQIPQKSTPIKTMNTEGMTK